MRVYVIGDDKIVVVKRSIYNYEVSAMYPADNSLYKEIFVHRKYNDIHALTHDLRAFFKVNPIRIYPTKDKTKGDYKC